MSEPRASRPDMPGYRLPAPDEGGGLLPWSWARERLEAAHNYWVGTTRPDSRPHVMPVWGLWLDDAFLFSTAPASRKAANLALNPYCTVTTERADEAVVVEGYAEELTDPDLLARFVEAYEMKYAFAMDPGGEGYFRVEPRTAFGFIEHADQFAATATRWRFGYDG